MTHPPLENLQPTKLNNRYCPYCGCDLENISKRERGRDHVIGRRFPPKGYLEGEWNLIVNACCKCNSRKGDLERDISAITLHPDAALDDEDRQAEFKRKATRTYSARTKKLVAASNKRVLIGLPGDGQTKLFTLDAPPQIDDERVLDLAHFQLRAFFYMLTYDDDSQSGLLWPIA